MIYMFTKIKRDNKDGGGLGMFQGYKRDSLTKRLLVKEDLLT